MSQKRSKPPSVCRRTFLRGAGSVVVGLPLLERFNERAFAQGTTPKRFAVVCTPEGAPTEPGDLWTPTGASDAPTLKPIFQPLLAAGLLPKLNVVTGVNNPAGARAESAGGFNGHNSKMGCALTGADSLQHRKYGTVTLGFPGSVSIDQAVAKHIRGQTPVESLVCMLFPNQNYPYISYGPVSWSAPYTPTSAVATPAAAFQKVFSGYAFSGAQAAPISDPEFVQLRARRESVLALVKNGIQRLKPKLGQADQQRLESHFQKIRELEVRLQSEEVPQVVLGGACKDPREGFVSGQAQERQTSENFVRVMAMALACNRTNVVLLQFPDNVTYPHVPNGSAFASGQFHTEVMHEMRNLSTGSSRWPQWKTQVTSVFQYFAERYALLCRLMDEVKEGDASLLDNSLALWTSEMGNAGGHSHNNIPFVLAGSAGKQMSTGRHLALGGENINNLYRTILNLFGSNATRFGGASFNSGQVSSLRV